MNGHLSELEHKIELELAKYPIMEYGFFNPTELEFSDTVRYICKTECAQYNHSWSCPPAVGSVSECKEKCLSYERAIFFTTVAEVEDLSNIEETLSTRKEHEAITRQMNDYLRPLQLKTFVLSAESCNICKSCSYPNAPCIHPDKMFPCIESFGILVTTLAERYGITFLQDCHTITWFSLIFFSCIQP